MWRPTHAVCRTALACALFHAIGWSQVTERVSVSSTGAQGNWGADLDGSDNSVSSDGRFVVFTSQSTNFFPGDINSWDVFVHDRLSGTTELLGLSSTGVPANGRSGVMGLTISRDGRFVAFESRAINLVPGDTNGRGDIFVRDRLNETTERVSTSSTGTQGNGDSWRPSISDDGRLVAFLSMSSNLVAGDTNGADDVFVHDRWTGITERVSLGTRGIQGDSYSNLPSISADGRFVAFVSASTNLVSGDTNGINDVFVHDRLGGSTSRVSVASGGGQADTFGSGYPHISGDGRCVVFTSGATNLVPGDTNGCLDAFLHDRRSGSTERVSLATDESQAEGDSNFASISADGRYVAFSSFAANLVVGGANGINVYVRDRLSGTTEIASVTTSGARTRPAGNNQLPSISADGRYVVFRSYNRDLVPGDSNGLDDVFLRDRVATSFVSLCSPGLDGVIDCPCSNQPPAADHGCSNSSSTAGAQLSASGIAYLAQDSLVFTTSGEGPHALSTLFEGTGVSQLGSAFGQGVRCASGRLLRLYTKIASSGCITAPDIAQGDPSVSSRSAARGLQIQSGRRYFYFVAYRDPIVLGRCPMSATFNVTQTGRLTWWP